jgi:hypothetical protein
MVPSYVIAIAVDDESLMCGEFSLGETVRLGNIEFIANYFGGLSLSPMWGEQTPLSWAQLIAEHLLRGGP